MRTNKAVPRCFMYTRYLHHPGVSKIQYKTFFHMCRMRNVSFDLEQRQGSTFMLQDCLQSGLLALMTIGEQRIDCLRMMCHAFKFIEEVAGPALPSSMQNPNETRSDGLDAMDVISSTRLIHKTYLKRVLKERLKREHKI